MEDREYRKIGVITFTVGWVGRSLDLKDLLRFLEGIEILSFSSFEIFVGCWFFRRVI